jgi:hypothetical protein
LEEGRQWKVHFKGWDYPYATRQAALSAAIEAARKISLIEKQVEVHLRHNDGKWQVVWTSRSGDAFEKPADQFDVGLAAFSAVVPSTA